MEYFKTNAIVLRVGKYSETSLIAALLTAAQGRVSVLAKGARRPKSEFFGMLDVYQELEVIYSPRGGSALGLLLEASPLDEHTGLRLCPPAFAAAGVLAELALLACPRHQPQERLFAVYQNALSLLARLGEPAARAGLAPALGLDPASKKVLTAQALQTALLNALDCLGVGLRLERCVLCGAPAGQGCALSRRAGGLVCHACRRRVRDALGVSAPGLASLTGSDDAALDLPQRERTSLLAWTIQYARCAADKPLRSAKVLFGLL